MGYLSEFQKTYALPSLYDVPVEHAQMVIGIRHILCCRLVNADPLHALIQRFRTVGPVRELLHIADVICTVWPGKFVLMRPCCRSISPDETILLAALSAAQSRDFATFRSKSSDMLTPDAARTLFTAVMLYHTEIVAK